MVCPVAMLTESALLTPLGRHTAGVFECAVTSEAHPREVGRSWFPTEIRQSRSRETLAGVGSDEIGKGQDSPLGLETRIGPPVKFNCAGRQDLRQ